jgi:uncharacterized membrane protein YeaQ/YmgE (transglycosylase-associated protein family)
MFDIEVSRLIAAAVAAVLLGWALYVNAFVKHKNDIKDQTNRMSVYQKQNSEQYAGADAWDRIRIERSSTWYLGYRLALIGLIIVAAAVGWVAAWIIGGEYEITWVEDCLAAAAGAIIGGFLLDKFIIHPIADGSFFEKVEDPLVEYFLENGVLPFEKVEAPAAPEVPEVPEEAEEEKDPFADLTPEEKLLLITKLKKTL